MGAPDSPSHSGELWPWNQVESKLQVGGMAFCGWAELGQQEPTLPALDLPQSNPRPREPSFHTLQKLWQPSPSSEGIQSWVYKHAGAYRETGREVLLLSVSSSWIFVANTLMPDLITAPRRSLKGLPLPQHLLLSGLRLLWCLLHPPDKGTFIFDVGVGMNYAHTPLNADLMRRFLFCSLLWLLMDSSLWIKHGISNLMLQEREELSLQLGTWRRLFGSQFQL